MYQFSGKLKTFSLALILLGVIGIAYSFLTAPSSLQEAKDIIALQSSHGNDHGDSHGEEHQDKVHTENHESTSGEHTSNSNIDKEMSAHGAHNDDTHAEHVLHQLQNRPWSAFYVALFFFLGIS